MERPPTTPERPSGADPAEEDEARGPDGLDLATIGLAVFFVSLILVVGALLILPALV